MYCIFDNEIIFLSLILVSGTDDVDGYAKTEGAWILSLHKRQYSTNTVAECAIKCNTESTFTCKQVHTFKIQKLRVHWHHNLTFTFKAQHLNLGCVFLFAGHSCILKKIRSVGWQKQTLKQSQSCAEPV